MMQLLVLFALASSVLSVPFEIPLQRANKAAIHPNGPQEWLEKMADGMANGDAGQVEMPKKAKCPFRNIIGGGEQNKGAPTAEINNFIDTFLVGQIEVGTPPQKFDVIMDTTMFVRYGVPASFLIDSKTCEPGQNLPCEKMQLFDASASATFSKWPSVKNYTLGKDIISFAGVKAKANFLLLNGKDFVGSRSFDVIYETGAMNVPRLDGIFSMAFTSSLMPIKSGMEYLLEEQKIKIATVYVEPLKALDFFAKQSGMITVGGLDTQRCEANYEWINVPLTAQRWRIPLKSVEYGGQIQWPQEGEKGIAHFSTFHAFIYAPKRVVEPLYKLVKFLKEPVAGKEPKDVAIVCDRSKLPDIKFTFGNRQFVLTPEQYVLDVVLDPRDPTKNICHLMIRTVPDDVPDVKELMKPNDWFFGQLFFNQFCIAFDYTPRKQKIGIAMHL